MEMALSDGAESQSAIERARLLYGGWSPLVGLLKRTERKMGYGYNLGNGSLLSTG
jgi:hypothetical protein